MSNIDQMAAGHYQAAQPNHETMIVDAEQINRYTQHGEWYIVDRFKVKESRQIQESIVSPSTDRFWNDHVDPTPVTKLIKVTKFVIARNTDATNRELMDKLTETRNRVSEAERQAKDLKKEVDKATKETAKVSKESSDWKARYESRDLDFVRMRGDVQGMRASICRLEAHMATITRELGEARVREILEKK